MRSIENFFHVKHFLTKEINTPCFSYILYYSNIRRKSSGYFNQIVPLIAKAASQFILRIYSYEEGRSATITWLLEMKLFMCTADRILSVWRNCLVPKKEGSASDKKKKKNKSPEVQTIFQQL
ncbi:MAG: hypothetical protein GX661_02565 [Acholeplasmataceae bacterium]|nr:hypothetical protein [Acholeplasmataceae bacterium]